MATRTRQAFNEAATDRITSHRKDDWHCTCRLHQGPHRRSAIGQDDVRRECNQFRRVPANVVSIRARPAGVDPHVTANTPARFLQTLQKRAYSGLKIRIVGGYGQEHADPPHRHGLLRTRRERPRGRAAKKRDELAPTHHSITSSAATSSLSGTVRPRAFAVFALIANSNFTVCWTGKSAGFSPLRIRPT